MPRIRSRTQIDLLTVIHSVGYTDDFTDEQHSEAVRPAQVVHHALLYMSN
jgi:hypothetical protein